MIIGMLLCTGTYTMFKNVQKNDSFRYLVFVPFFLLHSVVLSQKLYIYYPVPMKPRAIQEQFSASCPGFEIKVFGRNNDFITIIKQDSPEAIITKTELIRYLPDYTVKLNGMRQGVTEESYVLMSVNNPLKISALGPEKVIGVLDFLGRTKMFSFIKELTNTEPKIKRVAKVEDLLPLLSFDMAKGVILTEYNSTYIQEKSKLTFFITPIEEKKYGIISLAIKNGIDGSQIEETVKKVVPIMGIDKWQK